MDDTARSRDTEQLPRGEYGFPGPFRDALVSAVLSGRKSSTTSLVEDHRRSGEPLPVVGDQEVVIDSGEAPVCVTRVTSVDVVRLGDVTLDHAVAEGEGLATVEEWRQAHERFWRSEEMTEALGEPAVVIDDDTQVVCATFEVVRRL